MSFKRAAIRFLAETLVGNTLAKIGEHVGEAVGVKLARKIDPEYQPPPKEDPDDEC